MVFSLVLFEELLRIIIVLFLAVVLLGIVGTGALAQPKTNINLFVQAIGLGEADLESPITNAKVDLMLELIPSEDPQAPPITNVAACGFHSDESIPAGTGKSDGKLVCKLLNVDGNAIAEGSVTFVQYTASDTIEIPINQPVFVGATNFANVFDSMVIILGPL